jgi:hypothetical protein
MATKILKSLVGGYLLVSVFFAFIFGWNEWYFGFAVSIMMAWPAILVVSGLAFLLLSSIEEQGNKK